MSVNIGFMSLLETGVNWFVCALKLKVFGFKSVVLCKTEYLGFIRILCYYGS